MLGSNLNTFTGVAFLILRQPRIQEESSSSSLLLLFLIYDLCM